MGITNFRMIKLNSGSVKRMFEPSQNVDECAMSSKKGQSIHVPLFSLDKHESNPSSQEVVFKVEEEDRKHMENSRHLWPWVLAKTANDQVLNGVCRTEDSDTIKFAVNRDSCMISESFRLFTGMELIISPIKDWLQRPEDLRAILDSSTYSPVFLVRESDKTGLGWKFIIEKPTRDDKNSWDYQDSTLPGHQTVSWGDLEKKAETGLYNIVFADGKKPLLV
jgi:hypothetical protein